MKAFDAKATCPKCGSGADRSSYTVSEGGTFNPTLLQECPCGCRWGIALPLAQDAVWWSPDGRHWQEKNVTSLGTTRDSARWEDCPVSRAHPITGLDRCPVCKGWGQVPAEASSEPSKEGG